MLLLFSFKWPPHTSSFSYILQSPEYFSDIISFAVKMEDESSYYDRTKEVKEFDESKAGVKGLVDSGITKVPKFLIHPPHSLSNSETTNVDFKVPVIDFYGFDQDFRRAQIVKEICEASETWGFFQMVNHGVPERVIENMLEGIRGFHEQPKEVKMEWYSRDSKHRVRYYCNGDLLVSKTANWRDTIGFDFQDGPLDPETFPFVCRYFSIQTVQSTNTLTCLTT